MEPFFIFCLVLVFYCGYLTAADLLRGVKSAPVVTTTTARTSQAIASAARVLRPHRSCYGAAAS